MNLRVHLIVSLILDFLIVDTSGKLHRPLGVSIARAALYQVAQEFICFDGLATISYEHINDNYCDCADGSDEPGTSACPNGTFDCVNHGYRSISIPSSRVNDGICDCCDGSDEYETESGCSNSCFELGRQLRELTEKRYRVLVAGHELFKEYIMKGDEAKKETLKKLESLDKDKKDLEKLKLELESLKVAAELAEQESKNQHQKMSQDAIVIEKERKLTEQAAVVFHELDVDRDSLVTVNELFVHHEFDADADGQVSLDEARSCLGDRDQVDLKTFAGSVWSNIRLIYRYREDVEGLSEQEQVKDDAGNGNQLAGSGNQLDGNQLAGSGNQLDGNQLAGNGNQLDGNQLAGSGNQLDGNQLTGNGNQFAHDEFMAKLERTFLEPSSSQVEAKRDEDESTYDVETKMRIAAADRARHEFNEVSEKLDDVMKEINELQTILRDVAPSQYFSFHNECFDLKDREFIFSFCPFRKVVRRLADFDFSILLGKWSHWIDEPETNSATAYENGDPCSVDKRMSAVVRFKCNLTNELVFDALLDNCRYDFTFKTPAACSQPPPATIKDPLHDEL